MPTFIFLTKEENYHEPVVGCICPESAKRSTYTVFTCTLGVLKLVLKFEKKKKKKKKYKIKQLKQLLQ